jgi:hypothetical protein
MHNNEKNMLLFIIRVRNFMYNIFMLSFIATYQLNK